MEINKSKIVVLGAGLVGSAIAKDLAKTHQVTSVDRSREALEPLVSHGIAIQVADLSDSAAVAASIQEADLVIGAVPGFMGYQTLKTVIEHKKNAVDISFLQKIHLSWMHWPKPMEWWLLWIVELRQVWAISFLVITISSWRSNNTNVW